MIKNQFTNIFKHASNFNYGSPSPDLHPIDLYEVAFAETLETFKLDSEKLNEALGYGNGIGNTELLEEVTKLYKTHLNYKIEEEKVIITHGIRDSLLYFLNIFSDKPQKIVVEDPCFFIIMSSFKQSNLELVSFKHSSFVEDLEIYLKDGNEIGFCYVCPIFHNPTGTNMSVEDKKKLIKLSQEYDFLILSDEVYQFLKFKTDENIMPLCSFDDCATGGTVLSIGSFSKLLSPGLRTGWAMINNDSNLFEKKELFNNEGWLFCSGDFQPTISAVISNMMKENEFEKHLKLIKEVYSNRLDILCEELGKCDKFKFTKPRGGYFLWVELQKDVNVSEFEKLCEEEEVFFRNGNVSSNEKMYDNHIRLSFGFVTEDEVKEGVKKMISVLEKMKQNI